jgi:outer membrane lipoprotein-sorting protein
VGAIACSLWVLGYASLHPAQAVEPPDPTAIVERADRIRFPSGGFQVDVTITTSGPRREPEVKQYRVLSKGNENALVLTTAPAADRGTILLMRGDDLWAFVPTVSQPVRLPLSQRLTGQVANGDLARANLSGDYDASLVGVETVDGKPHYLLELKASRKGVTYPRVRYWVSQTTFRPHRAEFYTLSGRLLKTCRYEAFKPLGGAERPTRMVMEDALKKGEVSVMDYRDLTERELPDKVFTKEYLKKLQ